MPYPGAFSMVALDADSDEFDPLIHIPTTIYCNGKILAMGYCQQPQACLCKCDGVVAPACEKDEHDHVKWAHPFPQGCLASGVTEVAVRLGGRSPATDSAQPRIGRIAGGTATRNLWHQYRLWSVEWVPHHRAGTRPAPAQSAPSPLGRPGSAFFSGGNASDYGGARECAGARLFRRARGANRAAAGSIESGPAAGNSY